MILKKYTDISEVDFVAGTTILIDKPLEWTSFDVVNKVRYALKRLLNVKKIKVGHAGTLDPLATGLLILCTGKATKTIDSIQSLFKAYEGSFCLGASTPSFDAETEPNYTYPIDHITTKLIQEKTNNFVGTIDQKPPIFSAIKKNGKALYKYARKGEKVEVPTRKIQIHKFDITKTEIPNLEFRVECSKGTYIRSLAHDFGHALGSGAYLSSLIRTSIGEHDLKDAWNLENFISVIDDMSLSK